MNAADILGKIDRTPLEVTPPNATKVVRLRYPTYGEWHRLASAHTGLDGKTPSAELITETIAVCLCDENGKRILADASKARVLLDADPRAVMWLYAHCWKTVLRNDNEVIDELEKNSEAGQD